jgi:hypothetical protein
VAGGKSGRELLAWLKELDCPKPSVRSSPGQKNGKGRVESGSLRERGGRNLGPGMWGFASVQHFVSFFAESVSVFDEFEIYSKVIGAALEE